MYVLNYYINKLDIYKYIKPLINPENLNTLKNILYSTYTEELVDFPNMTPIYVASTLMDRISKSMSDIHINPSIIKSLKTNGATSDAEIKAGLVKDIINKVQLRDASRLFSAIIKFPEITIQTTITEKQHKVTDLYVKLPITITGQLAINCFYVQRGVLTPVEYKHGYKHSHVPALCPNGTSWGKFCTGKGPLKLLSEKLFLAFNSKMWIVFLAELNRALTVESEEGGPYIKIETLSLYKVKASSTLMYIDRVIGLNYSSSYEVNKNCRYFINNYIMPNIDKFIFRVNTEFYIRGNFGSICSDFTNLYKQYVKKTNTALFPMIYPKTFSNNNYTYYDVEEDSKLENLKPLYLFTFKGEKIYRTIKTTSDIEHIRENMVKVVKPETVFGILYYITKYLKYYEYKKITENSHKQFTGMPNLESNSAKSRVAANERFMWAY